MQREFLHDSCTGLGVGTCRCPAAGPNRLVEVVRTAPVRELRRRGLGRPIDPDLARSFVADTSSETVAPAVVDMLVADILKVPARVWQAMFSGLLDYDDTPELTRVGAPTFLIWGDDDALVSREMQEVLTDRIPHAELIVYADVGHTPRWADPQRFSEDLAAFVDGYFPNLSALAGCPRSGARRPIVLRVVTHCLFCVGHALAFEFTMRGVASWPPIRRALLR